MRRTARGALLALALCALAGCGIRGTAVPVDAGGAPSRATCQVHPQAPATPPAGTVSMPVQLVCTSQLLPVTRAVATAGRQDAPGLAQALLDELRRQPTPAEDEAGFSTDVPQRLTVTGPRQGDPADALRLSTPPDELSPLALAQVVCTFAGTAATGGKRVVVLGGPGAEPPRGYPCTEETRAHPETLQGGGTPAP
ncbi:hypothetical protein [Streptomyces orinoci]|uniref:Lipoprotein n=1 Tax=Streptomyces orinoci TaxID=67339 RepID=A0ABV3JUG2_STRON|nr:hypothetical protein [Streptomyces orinoci]